MVVHDDEDRILLTERTDGLGWCLPGGSAEPEDTFVETALAELREEAGIVAQADALTAFATVSERAYTQATFPNGDELRSFNVCFVARDWHGAAAPDGQESSRVGFFPRASLPESLLPLTARTLELYDAWRASGVFQAR